MPSRALPMPVPHPAFEYAAIAPSDAPATATAPSVEISAAAPPEASTPHRAVEAVLRAVDHVATQHRHSVNLRFSIGGSDLNVRVELRADEVRTTFSTDSAELRSALSQEWQALAHASTDGTTRIAAANFTSASDPSSSQTFSGDASSRDRQQQRDESHDAAPRDAREPFAQGRAGFSPLSDSARVAGRTEVRPASGFARAGSRHLHTLA